MKRLFYILFILFPSLTFASPCIVEAKYPFEKELQLNSGAFVSEVISIKPLSKQIHGSVVRYRAEFSALHILKGVSPKKFFLEYNATYRNPLVNDGKILLGGFGTEVGAKFVIFQKALDSGEMKSCDRFARPMHLIPKKYQIY